MWPLNGDNYSNTLVHFPFSYLQDINKLKNRPPYNVFFTISPPWPRRPMPKLAMGCGQTRTLHVQRLLCSFGRKFDGRVPLDCVWTARTASGMMTQLVSECWQRERLVVANFHLKCIVHLREGSVETVSMDDNILCNLYTIWGLRTCTDWTWFSYYFLILVYVISLQTL